VKQSEVTINGSTIRMPWPTAGQCRERCWRKSAPPASPAAKPPLHFIEVCLPGGSIGGGGQPYGVRASGGPSAPRACYQHESRGSSALSHRDIGGQARLPFLVGAEPQSPRVAPHALPPAPALQPVTAHFSPRCSSPAMPSGAARSAAFPARPVLPAPVARGGTSWDWRPRPGDGRTAHRLALSLQWRRGFGLGGLTMFHALPCDRSNLSMLHCCNADSAVAAAADRKASVGAHGSPRRGRTGRADARRCGP